MKYLLITIMLFLLSSCTDAGWAKFGALGTPGKVVCYSGGTLIYSGESTGKIKSESSSDGYYFVDRKSMKLMEVSGNCVITYGN